MARARQLLDTTKLHVAEIGREVGYADPFNFPASSAACTA
jgi:transcriptional regulator GlxA family with amidase domain